MVGSCSDTIRSQQASASLLSPPFIVLELWLLLRCEPGTQTLTLTLAWLVFSGYCAAVGGALSHRQSHGYVVGGTGIQGVVEMVRDCLLDCRNKGKSPQFGSLVQSECSMDK